MFSPSPSSVKRNWPHVMFCVMPSLPHQITKNNFVFGMLFVYKFILERTVHLKEMIKIPLLWPCLIIGSQWWA